MAETVFLSRRNLQTLLNKLDRAANGDSVLCRIAKYDNAHPKYPQTMTEIHVVAVEDEEYYAHREAGVVHPDDDPKTKHFTNSCGPGGPTKKDRALLRGWGGGPL